MTPFDKLEAISEQIDGDFRPSYSGRGMGGRTCGGIVTDDPMRCIELAAQRGITGANTDSMGRQTIVYWPSLTEDSV